MERLVEEEIEGVLENLLQMTLFVSVKRSHICLCIILSLNDMEKGDIE